MRRFQYQLLPAGELLITDRAGYRVDWVIRGDFPSDTHRREYAEEVVRALNAAPIPTLQHTRWPWQPAVEPRATEKHPCF